MKDRPEKLSENGFTSKSSGDSIDDLVSFARDHFATDFPNPKRIDCLPPETYSQLIARKELPSEELQAHLQSCSECFRLYRSLLDADRKTVVLKPDWSVGVPWYKRVLTFGVPVILICSALFGLYLYYQTRPRPTDQTAVSSPLENRRTNIEPEPTVSKNARTLLTPEHESRSPQSRKSPPHPIVAVHTVVIDFGRQQISRSGSQRQIPITTLVAGQNRLTLKLSAESPKGDYLLTLNDSFGKEVKQLVTTTFDGRALHADIDLDSITSGSYLICIAHAAEVPDCLPVSVKAK